MVRKGRGNTRPQPLLVTARLVSPIAGEHAPMLDALLEDVVCRFASAGVERERLTRGKPCPPSGLVPIAISRLNLGGWEVPKCSSPIFRPVSERVDYVHKKLAVENASLLAAESRLKVATTGGEHKSYRLPLRARLTDTIRWICFANRPELRRQLKRVRSLGKKRSVGYGVVDGWEVEPYTVGEHWWYAPSEHGPVLMRPLPVGPWLPNGLVGCVRGFGSCVPPYWHPERFCDMVRPC